MKILIQFSITYLCEKAFSSITAIKTQYRSHLEIKVVLCLAVTTVDPNIHNLISKHLNRYFTSRARFCFQPGSNNGPPACLFLEESISERRGMDSKKPFSPTSSGSNTIRSWSPTSSTDTGTTFATNSFL
ncbi:hypothetical protein TNCV_2846081 [Trichonephila clavipes]|nr:hypothetical protein TNCV_2846081 [Trichonephila clavipes]